MSFIVFSSIIYPAVWRCMGYARRGCDRAL